YTSAVIHEVQRKGNISPFGAPRMAVKDTVVDGFCIPKVTPLLTSETLPRDSPFPRHVSPGQVHPVQTGLCSQRRLRLPWVTVSAGKRSCLGELLARTELFLFFTALLQKF
ncbi:CP2J3 protein, partial [Alopecoenas beccarii]|nr:CP2J3 protein [Alopecoenas beccarii]